MKKWSLLFFTMLLLIGCSKPELTPVNPHEQFVATVNIEKPSVQFFSNSCEAMATWEFDVPYTGGTLVGFDQLFLYGNQMKEAHLYEISTGKKLRTVEVPVGTTNGYYDVESKRLFVTNSKTNELMMFDASGKQLNKMKLRNYPMSMIAKDGRLYVVNYKDTVLSVLDIKTFDVVDEWAIPYDSHGLLVKEEAGELWLGGHGAGSTPNVNVRIFDLVTGEIKKELPFPMMPVAFAASKDEVSVISHGNSTLYIVSDEKEVALATQIGSNPFAVAYWKEALVVAGYDDDTLYFVEEGQVAKQCATLDGPFQLIVRGP